MEIPAPNHQQQDNLDAFEVPRFASADAQIYNKPVFFKVQLETRGGSKIVQGVIKFNRKRNAFYLTDLPTKGAIVIGSPIVSIDGEVVGVYGGKSKVIPIGDIYKLAGEYLYERENIKEKLVWVPNSGLSRVSIKGLNDEGDFLRHLLQKSGYMSGFEFVDFDHDNDRWKIKLIAKKDYQKYQSGRYYKPEEIIIYSKIKDKTKESVKNQLERLTRIKLDLSDYKYVPVAPIPQNPRKMMDKLLGK